MLLFFGQELTLVLLFHQGFGEVLLYPEDMQVQRACLKSTR